MSADNWAVCPRCLRDRGLKSEKAQALEQISEAYGKVSPDKYIEMVNASKGLSEEIPNTLREDYEQFMRPDGTYEVHYGCSCKECGFGWSYKHIEKVKL